MEEITVIKAKEILRKTGNVRELLKVSKKAWAEAVKEAKRRYVGRSAYDICEEILGTPEGAMILGDTLADGVVYGWTSGYIACVALERAGKETVDLAELIGLLNTLDLLIETPSSVILLLILAAQKEQERKRNIQRVGG